MYRIIFVDDRTEDFKKLDNLTKVKGVDIKIESLLPKAMLTETAKEIVDSNPDLVILDYRLDEKPLESGQFINYKAGPLAQHLRDRAIENIRNDTPIIAVSYEDKMRDFYNPNETVHDLFDRVYLKDDILEKPGRIKKELIAYIEAYKEIINYFGHDDMLHRLLRMDNAESGFIDYQYFKELSHLKAPHLIVRRLFPVLIERSWLLLDSDDLFALLGINPECKNSEDFSTLIASMVKGNAKYSGIFSSGFDRWWLSRVKSYFENICPESPGNLTAKERVDCLNQILKLSLKPAISRWIKNSNTYMSFACSSCKYPTEEEFSVAAYDQLLPPFLSKKRICWKCIQTGEYEEKKLLIDEGDLYIAEKIKNGEITPD
jgi:hypothetical protein